MTLAPSFSPPSGSTKPYWRGERSWSWTQQPQERESCRSSNARGHTASTRVVQGWDTMTPPDNTERLAAILGEAGADLDLRWKNVGHPLTHEEIEEARDWLSRLPT